MRQRLMAEIAARDAQIAALTAERDGAVTSAITASAHREAVLADLRRREEEVVQRQAPASLPTPPRMPRDLGRQTWARFRAVHANRAR